MAQVISERTDRKASSSIPNYRQQIRRSLPDEVFHNDAKSLLWFPVHFGIIGICWWALATHFSWWYAPIASLIVGHSIACMGFLAHDIAHGGGFKSVAIRDLLSGIGFSPLWIGPRLWRRWHNAEHHGHTQIEGVDPDHLFTMEHYQTNPILRLLYRISPVLRNIVIFGSFSFRMTQQQLRMVITYVRSPKITGYEKLVIVSQLIAAMTAWLGLSALLGSQVLIWGYLLPVLVGNAIAISYIATNHFLNPLADESDVLGSSLTVTLPKGLRWLDPWHSYFGAHVAHHLFPQVAGRNCRVIEQKAAELFPERYHSMPLFRALVMLGKTPWIYDNKKDLLDPVRDERWPTLGHGLEDQIKKDE